MAISLQANKQSAGLIMILLNKNAKWRHDIMPLVCRVNGATPISYIFGRIVSMSENFHNHPRCCSLGSYETSVLILFI